MTDGPADEPRLRGPLARGLYPDDERPPPRPKRSADERERDLRARLGRFGGPVVVAGIVLWRFGQIALVALGKAALIFKIPLLGTVVSAGVSIGAYTLLWGLPFAVGLVLSLLVHELGHVVALRREGIPVKAMNFVPFLGAYVLSEVPRTPQQQARISLGGPIAGTLGALCVLAVSGGDPMLLAIAFTGFFLNALNLLPFAILDGAGVAMAVGPRLWFVLAALIGLVAVAVGSGLVGILALGAALRGVLDRSGDGPAASVAPGEQAGYAAVFALVVAVCAVGMAATFDDRRGDLVDRYGAAPSGVVAQR